MMGYYGGNMVASLGWGLSMLLMMLVPVAIIVIVVLLVLKVWERHSPAAKTAAPDPLAVLQLRYAKGEVTADEYRQIKEELQRT